MGRQVPDGYRDLKLFVAMIRQPGLGIIGEVRLHSPFDPPPIQTSATSDVFPLDSDPRVLWEREQIYTPLLLRFGLIVFFFSTSSAIHGSQT